MTTWTAAACLAVAAVVAGWPVCTARARRRQVGIGPGAASSRTRYGRLRGPAAGSIRRAGAWVHEVGRLHEWPLAVTCPAAGVLAGYLAAVWLGPVAGAITAGYGGLAARTVLRGRAGRAAAVARTAVLDGLCALAADLRAGQPATTAWAAAGFSPHTPARAGFGPLTAAGATGSGGGPGTVRPGLDLSDRESIIRPVRLASAAARLAERTGAPLADLVERIEADARAMDRARAAAAAQVAGARATGWLLAGLPVGGIALGYGIGVDPLRVLLHTPVGGACAIGAVALQLAGLAWVDRLSGGGGSG